MKLLVLPLTLALCWTSALAQSDLPPGTKMSWLENDKIKLGVDLNRGGAIVYLAPKGGQNVVNNFDLGRQVQLSFFSGPVPFGNPAEHWNHIGWNPIQAGDDFGNRGETLTHTNDQKSIHLTCKPLQWPLNNVPGDCLFESWLELDGAAVKARARLQNKRSDTQQYPARLQELPAVYANARFHRVVSYQGAKPFSGQPFSAAPEPSGKHPWSFWLGTEGWAALLDENDVGLGLITPGRVHFTGGFAGKAGPNDTMANSTGYLAGQSQDILDHNIVFDFGYELVLGSVDQIRQRAAIYRPNGLPEWSFSQYRQGWHHQNVEDEGWPVKDGLHLKLTGADPQMISPYTFWNADDAPEVEVEAATNVPNGSMILMWQRLGDQAIPSANHAAASVIADGEFHPVRFDLSKSEAYQGSIVRLRLDPPGGGSPDQWFKVRKITVKKGGSS
ncbi:MAG: hypothetical protein JNJ83_14360 [Verrucomicrobiaceae bacterium]|nr:hypothetical protein [Verrucomicrobiaceae bacterium]